MTMTEQFSTLDVEPSQRLAFWNQLGRQTYSELVVEPRRTGSAFGGVLLRRSYGDMLVTQVTTTPASVLGEAQEPSGRDAEHAFVLVQEVGTSDHVIDGRPLSLEPGTLAMNMTSRASSIAFDEMTRFLIVKLPVPRLAARVGNLQRLIGRRVEARDAALLADLLRTLLAQDDVADEPGWSEAIGDVIADLIALTFHHVPAAPAPSRSVVAERWQRTVRAFVDQHLADPELGAAMIAARLGVTPRYVQMVFASMSTTASAYIVGRRLELAAQFLTTERQPVADVAQRSGFTDLSYFYRSFRKRYGVSPGRYAAR